MFVVCLYLSSFEMCLPAVNDVRNVTQRSYSHCICYSCFGIFVYHHPIVNCIIAMLPAVRQIAFCRWNKDRERGGASRIYYRRPNEIEGAAHCPKATNKLAGMRKTEQNQLRGGFYICEGVVDIQTIQKQPKYIYIWFYCRFWMHYLHISSGDRLHARTTLIGRWWW